jgi:hypothetical protein
VEDELQAPGAGQARVKILAADVSFSDVNIRRGRYPAPRGRRLRLATRWSGWWTDWAPGPRHRPSGKELPH